VTPSYTGTQMVCVYKDALLLCDHWRCPCMVDVVARLRIVVLVHVTRRMFARRSAFAPKTTECYRCLSYYLCKQQKSPHRCELALLSVVPTWGPSAGRTQHTQKAAPHTLHFQTKHSELCPPEDTSEIGILPIIPSIFFCFCFL
jgi:hypothetical protein